jgi:putative flippase GtrA
MTTRDTTRATAVRWLKFNAVGAAGIGVQLAALAVLKSGLRVENLLATVLAVEAAVVHNYVWHEKFTWLDQAAGSSWMRFVKFNLTAGLFSILGNVFFMRILVSSAGMNYFVGNMVAIAACSIVNFVVGDRFVFEGS